MFFSKLWGDWDEGESEKRERSDRRRERGEEEESAEEEGRGRHQSRGERRESVKGEESEFPLMTHTLVVEMEREVGRPTDLLGSQQLWRCVQRLRGVGGDGVWRWLACKA